MVKVLIIDDEKNIRETLDEILTTHNYHVITASDGLEGFDSIIENKPTIVLSDVNMPNLSGFELLKKVNEHFTSTDIAPSFIFISARITKDDIREGMRLGAEDYIIKPFTIKDILDTIDTKLKKRETLLKASATKERNRISQDLHDSIQQTFIGVLYSFNRLEDKFTDSKLQDIYEESIIMLKSGIRELRDVSKLLVTLSLDLKDNIREATSRTSELSDIEIEIIDSFKGQIIDSAHLDAFRIYQEAMNNILKYSNAKNVIIQFKNNESSYTLIITDDGVGFDLVKVKKGSGLLNMQNRAKNLSGKLKIDSKINEGTTISLEFSKNNWV